jgi:phage terminase large subunit-like protein
MIEFRQGLRFMAAPTRELEKLIISKKLAHGGNPVTRWMAVNVAVAQDPAGNLRRRTSRPNASTASLP